MSQQEFESYLKLLGRMLGLTAAQRQAIACELRDHLESRLEELSAQGYSHDEAVATALEEFGDAAALAEHFRIVARHRIRRHIMRTSLGLTGVAALILTTAYLLPEQRPMVPAPRIVAAQGEAVELTPADQEGFDVAGALEQRVTLSFDEMALEQVIASFENHTGLSVWVNWKALENHGVMREQPVTIRLREVPAARALELTLRQVSADARDRSILAYDVTDNVLMITTQYELGSRLEVRHYDVGHILHWMPKLEAGDMGRGGARVIHIERAMRGANATRAGEASDGVLFEARPLAEAVELRAQVERIESAPAQATEPRVVPREPGAGPQREQRSGEEESGRRQEERDIVRRVPIPPTAEHAPGVRGAVPARPAHPGRIFGPVPSMPAMLGGPPMWVQNLGGAEDRDKLVLQIIRLIQSATEPAAWDVNGGEGAISEFNGTLIVKADAQMHRRIADLIPTLHQALVEQAARSMRNEHVMRLMVEIDELRFAGKYESALEVVRQAMLIDPGHPMVQAARRVLEETIERKAGQ